MRSTFFIIFLIIKSVVFAQLPIKPTRNISFTTDEATYMDLDISPDGKKLVFTILGDIYSLPVTGGTATQLTHGIAWNRSPAWSPNGKSIAYASETQYGWSLSLMNASGTVHRTTTENVRVPIWTPDGNQISTGNYSNDRTMYGHFYDLSGGKFEYPNVLSSNRNLSIIDFSTDGKYMYFKDESGKEYATVVQYNRITGAQKQLVQLSNGSSGYLGFRLIGTIRISPDGNWIAYTKSGYQTSLVLVNVLTSQEKVIIPSIDVERKVDERFVFSPDSKSLFIGYNGKIHKISIKSATDEIIPFTAKVNVGCGPLSYHTFPVSQDPFKVRYTRSANASPDGKQLVFSALNRLYVMDLPNGKPRVLTDQGIGQFQPIYSPDGKWIAYVSWSDTGRGHLWRVAADGGKPEQLDHVAGLYVNPAWSSDNQSIAIGFSDDGFLGVGKGRKGQLQIIPLNGENLRIISDSLSLSHTPAFSSQDDRIIYTPMVSSDKKTGYPVLVSVQTDGKEIDKKVVALSMDGPVRQIISLSPDGRYIVYMLAEDLYILPVPHLGEPVTIFDPGQKLPVTRFAIGGIDPHWEKGGKVLSWSYSNKFFRIDPDKIISRAVVEAEKRKTQEVSDNSVTTLAINPDETINLNVTVPRLYGHGIVAIKNVRIITMKGNKVIEGGTALIKDGRFVAVGNSKNIGIPAGAKIYDLQGSTIMPGIVDVHGHLHVASEILAQQQWSCLVNLAYGVTTARDPSADISEFGYGELLEAGQMIGPRLYTSGVPAHEGMISPIKSLDDARALVHQRVLLGGTFVKQYMLNTEQKRHWLLMASNEAGLNMTNEGMVQSAYGCEMLSPMRNGSAGHEHNPYNWGNVYKDVISFVAKSGTYFTPTIQCSITPTEEYNAQHQLSIGFTSSDRYFHYLFRKNPDVRLAKFMPEFGTRRLLNDKPAVDSLDPYFVRLSKIDASFRKAGGRVTLGSHGNDKGIGAHFELWALQMGGLSNLEALQAATIMGAEAIGVQKDLGSIEVGKIADLIILDKNPLEDIHNSISIRYVMKDGVLYNGETMDIVWPFEKKLPNWRLISASK